jgi:hypothetical protein
MKRCEIIGTELLYNGSKLSVDELYDEEFNKYSDNQASEFFNDTYLVNELYQYKIRDYLAIKFFVAKNEIAYVDARNATTDIKYYVRNIAEEQNLQCATGSLLFSTLKSNTLFYLNQLLSFLYLAYLMLRIPKTEEVFGGKKAFSILRSKAGTQKMRNFVFISKEKEDIKDKSSIYRLFGKGERLSWTFKAYCNSFKSLWEFKAAYTPKLGIYFIYSIKDYYRKRIVHTELFNLLIKRFFSYYAGGEYYTANNLDRFSVLEERVAKENSIKTYNIPHGIEYGFKFPKGFSCDVFYAYTEYSSQYLNTLYHTSKFVFNQSVIEKMLKLDSKNVEHPQYVIFFTEPREINVNIEIVSALKRMMDDHGWPLYLKLHPTDKKSNYDSLGCPYITDYTESLVGNICISRKSTILLEAIYNGSIPIAIITNDKDASIFKTFPSLNSDKIIKKYNVEDLFNTIKDLKQ